MALALHRLHALQGAQLGQYALKQAGLLHQLEGHGRPAGDQHLVQLFGDALDRQDTQTVGHPAHGFKRFWHDRKGLLGSGELGRETDGPEHTQRVVGIRRIRVQRGPDDARGQVFDAAERVHQLAERIRLQRERHGVDGEIAALLVVLQGAVFHYRLARFAPVGLFPGAHEFDFIAFVVQHRGAEVFEIGHIRMRPLAHGACELDSAAFHDYVYIAGRAAEEAVAHIASDHEGTHLPLGGDFADEAEDLAIQILRHYCRHSISSKEGAAQRGSKRSPSLP